MYYSPPQGAPMVGGRAWAADSRLGTGHPHNRPLGKDALAPVRKRRSPRAPPRSRGSEPQPSSPPRPPPPPPPRSQSRSPPLRSGRGAGGEGSRRARAKSHDPTRRDPSTRNPKLVPLTPNHLPIPQPRVQRV